MSIIKNSDNLSLARVLGVKPLNSNGSIVYGVTATRRVRRPVTIIQATSPKPKQQVIRVLRWYKKDGDALVGEQVLNLNLRSLQKLFGESRDSLMFECYPVSRMQARYLQRRLRRSFDLDSYAYFLECDAV